MTELEPRHAPAVFQVSLREPEGQAGDTAASHSVQFGLSPDLTQGPNTVYVKDATSPGDAVSRGIVGTVDVELDGPSWSYDFTPATVGFSPSEQKPFLLTTEPGSKLVTIAFEDTVGRPGCDYDYNDRTWDSVSVAENLDDQGLILAGDGDLGNDLGETGKVYWSVRWREDSYGNQYHMERPLEGRQLRQSVPHVAVRCFQLQYY